MTKEFEQAHDRYGVPLFIHPCGTVMPSSVSGVTEGKHYRYPPCTTPGPWRPLYVTTNQTDTPEEIR